MRTRLARIEEAHSLAKLDKHSNLTNWDVNEYISSFNNTKHSIYVLEQDSGSIVATIVISIIFDEAEILQFWVKHECKKQGYGKILLEFILNKLKAMQKLHNVFLEVREDNTPAINLYQKLGFKIVGRRNNYYTVDNWQYDALTMLRSL